jgi:hypothetical protein
MAREATTKVTNCVIFGENEGIGLTKLVNFDLILSRFRQITSRWMPVWRAGQAASQLGYDGSPAA